MGKLTKGQRKKKLAEWKSVCSGKVGHTSMLSAEHTINNYNNKTQEIYQCKFCQYFHIGTKKKEK